MNHIAKPMTSSTGRLQQALRRAPLGALLTAALSLALTGCSLGTMQLSGADSTPVTGALHLTGNVHGGQNPISGATIQIWAVGGSGYGSQATPLVKLNGSGGSCSQSTFTISAFAITSNVVTFTTSANTLTVGESVVISGLSTGTYLNGATLVVTAATSTSFSASFTNTNVVNTADSGTGTPECAGVTTGSDGSFSVDNDYTCPTATSLVYLTATGGNPGLTAGTNNTAIKLAAPLGTCAGLTGTNVILNEVTTVGTAFALAQYFTPTFGATSSDSFGAPNTAQALTGITNAFSTFNNLVVLGSGNAIASTNLSGTLSGNAYTITVVPDSAKIYTMANILAACVNSTSASSSNCTTLFGAVAPSNATAPTDILQAAVDMALNPTSTNSTASATNITNLYNLQSPSSPYVGPTSAGLSAAPTDWTVAIQYQDTTGNYFLKPSSLAIDSVGNVWVLSNSSGSGGTPGALVELSNTGTPTNFVTTLNEYGPFASPIASPPGLSSLKTTTAEPFTYQNTVFTNNFGVTGSNPAISPRNVAIDTNNNVWFTASSSGTDGTTGVAENGNIFEITTSGTALGFSTGKAAFGLAIDGNNDVFVSQQSASAYFGMYEFPAGNLLTPITYQIPKATVGSPGTTGVNTYIQPQFMAFDTSGNLWMTGGSSSSSQNYAVALGNINTGTLVTSGAQSCSGMTAGQYCQVATTTTSNTYYTVSIGITDPWALAAGAGVMWIADAGTSGTAPDYTVTKISGAATPSTATFANFGSNTSILYPHYLAVDGGGNVWVGNQGGTDNGTAGVSGGITELNSAGTVLSPQNTTQPGFGHSTLNAAAGVGIDPSGNVWVANNTAYQAAVTGPPATPAVPSLVIELVGAAAPTVTPIALALKNGSVAIKP